MPTIIPDSIASNRITILWEEDDHVSTSTFSAIWLWHNRAENFLIPSGQRIHSPSAFPRDGRIISARIITKNNTKKCCNYADRLVCLGKESIHPIHMLETSYRNDDESLQDFNSSILLINWKYNGGNLIESGCNLNWLKRWSYDPMSLARSRKKREVTIHHTFIHKHKTYQCDPAVVKPENLHKNIKRNEDGLIHIHYDDIIRNKGQSSSKLLLLDSLFLDGAAIVFDAPSAMDHQEDTVTTLGKIISGGSLSHGSLYGDTFHVTSMPGAINVAYTSEQLCPHQDLAYYESKPGFQLLHCSSMPENIVGGESILIDCMAAAYRFREIAPSMFTVLVKCSVTFVKQRKGAFITYARPHISLAHDGHTDLNDMDREIVSVHWAPPFEGPLNILPEQIEDYYRAYAAFELMLDASKCPIQSSEAMKIDLSLAKELSKFSTEYTWERRLRPGEIMIFNNNRLLHGRKSFKLSPGGDSRHLIGAYTNIDDSLNNYRRLLLEENLFDRIIPNVGNGSSSVL